MSVSGVRGYSCMTFRGQVKMRTCTSKGEAEIVCRQTSPLCLASLIIHRKDVPGLWALRASVFRCSTAVVIALVKALKYRSR